MPRARNRSSNSAPSAQSARPHANALARPAPPSRRAPAAFHHRREAPSPAAHRTARRRRSRPETGEEISSSEESHVAPGQFRRARSRRTAERSTPVSRNSSRTPHARERRVGCRKQLPFPGSDVHDVEDVGAPFETRSPSVAPPSRFAGISSSFFLFFPQPPRDPRHRPPERRIPRRAGHEVSLPPDAAGPLVVAPVRIVERGLLEEVEPERAFGPDPLLQAVAEVAHAREG